MNWSSADTPSIQFNCAIDFEIDLRMRCYKTNSNELACLPLNTLRLVTHSATRKTSWRAAGQRFTQAVQPSADMATTVSGSQREPLTFTQLPYDVRVLIYEIALSHIGALNIILFPKTAPPAIPSATLLDRAHLNPAILRLNKGLGNEAMPYLYSRNTFTFDRLEDCRTFTDPAIPGRGLISRVGIHRMAMSRPICRWKSLLAFMPGDLRQLTIEVDTYSDCLLLLCRSLCHGLEICLKQASIDLAVRRAFFRDVVTLRLPTVKHLAGRIFAAQQSCLIASQKLLWQRFRMSIHVSHDAAEQRFKDLIEDGLVGAGVFGAEYGRALQVHKVLMANVPPGFE